MLYFWSFNGFSACTGYNAGDVFFLFLLKLLLFYPLKAIMIIYVICARNDVNIVMTDIFLFFFLFFYFLTYFKINCNNDIDITIFLSLKIRIVFSLYGQIRFL